MLIAKESDVVNEKNNAVQLAEQASTMYLDQDPNAEGRPLDDIVHEIAANATPDAESGDSVAFERQVYDAALAFLDKERSLTHAETSLATLNTIDVNEPDWRAKAVTLHGYDEAMTLRLDPDARSRVVGFSDGSSAHHRPEFGGWVAREHPLTKREGGPRTR